MMEEWGGHASQTGFFVLVCEWQWLTAWDVGSWEGTLQAICVSAGWSPLANFTYHVVYHAWLWFLHVSVAQLVCSYRTVFGSIASVVANKGCCL